MFKEGRRDTQRAGHVVETVYLYFTWQDLLWIHLNPHQVAHGGSKFSAVQALDWHMTGRFACFGVGIDRAFKVGNQGVDRFLRRLVLPGGGHQAAAQADNGLFPHLGVIAGLADVERG